MKGLEPRPERIAETIERADDWTKRDGLRRYVYSLGGRDSLGTVWVARANDWLALPNRKDARVHHVTRVKGSER